MVSFLWLTEMLIINRRLLDAQLQRCIEEGMMLNTRSGNPVVNAIMALLTLDGLTE